MGTDTRHFSSHMLRITGTLSIPTQHHLPLASEGGHQFAGYLQDERRHGCQLVDNREMLLKSPRDSGLSVYTYASFLS